MRRLMSAVKFALRTPQTDAPVHFHKGPEGSPAVCYDARCSIPHLTVD